MAEKLKWVGACECLSVVAVVAATKERLHAWSRLAHMKVSGVEGKGSRG
jgi:hypothetical protein